MFVELNSYSQKLEVTQTSFEGPVVKLQSIHGMEYCVRGSVKEQTVDAHNNLNKSPEKHEVMDYIISFFYFLYFYPHPRIFFHCY